MAISVPICMSEQDPYDAHCDPERPKLPRPMLSTLTFPAPRPEISSARTQYTCISAPDRTAYPSPRSPSAASVPEYYYIGRRPSQQRTPRDVTRTPRDVLTHRSSTFSTSSSSTATPVSTTRTEHYFIGQELDRSRPKSCENLSESPNGKKKKRTRTLTPPPVARPKEIEEIQVTSSETPKEVDWWTEDGQRTSSDKDKESLAGWYEKGDNGNKLPEKVFPSITLLEPTPRDSRHSGSGQSETFDTINLKSAKTSMIEARNLGLIDSDDGTPKLQESYRIKSVIMPTVEKMDELDSSMTLSERIDSRDVQLTLPEKSTTPESRVALEGLDEDQKLSVYESYMQRDFIVPGEEDKNMTSPMHDTENDSATEHFTATEAEASTRRGEVTMSGRSTIDERESTLYLGDRENRESEAVRLMPTVVEQAPSATMFEDRKHPSEQTCLRQPSNQSLEDEDSWMSCISFIHKVIIGTVFAYVAYSRISCMRR